MFFTKQIDIHRVTLSSLWKINYDQIMTSVFLHKHIKHNDTRKSVFWVRNQYVKRHKQACSAIQTKLESLY